MLALYPVGTVYISANSTSPASLFGGTWESIGGRFLLGADAIYTAGSTGGEAAHTLTVDEMPSHNHGVGLNDSGSTTSSGLSQLYTNTYRTYSDTIGEMILKTGGSKPHNNMPPYLAVYMWKRVS